MKRINRLLVYEIVFTILAVLAVSIAIADLRGAISIDNNPTWHLIDVTILIIFAIDYFVRLFIAKDKKIFIRGNIPDLIAIIPFNAVFKVFRVAKLFRVAKVARVSKLTKLGRFIAVLSRLGKRINEFLRTNGLIYVMYFSVLVILVSAVTISYSDGLDFEDSLWWAFVTATTVGYGDFYPTSIFGRLVAAILMLIGIGTIGMITGTIATYFISKKEPHKEGSDLEIAISNCKDLTDTEKEQVISFANYLIIRRNNGDRVMNTEP